MIGSPKSSVTFSGTSLGAIAQTNLTKITSRWLDVTEHDLFDEGCDSNERLPRTFVAELRDVDDGNGRRVIRMTLDGE
jgi:hypothetical protein